MADSPGSPLSSHASSEFTEDVRTEDQDPNLDSLLDHPDGNLMPPAKRQRREGFSHRSTPMSHFDIQQEDEYDGGDISSDTSGDVPNSPPAGSVHVPEDEQPLEQVTVCKWHDCNAGDLGNMDALVEHIHKDHIGHRQKRYICVWEGCPRINMNHASGYALRAHMRSHTREKPFFCALPECDRSFTRSDALAKHMRTVHETEALRPSDPIPRNHSSAQIKPQRLKLIVNAKPPSEEPKNTEPMDADDDATIYTGTDADPEPQQTHTFEYPPDVHFTDEERVMSPNELYRLLRRQVHWAEEERQELRDELVALEAKRKEEWQAKELVLTNVMEAELACAYKFGDEGSDKVPEYISILLPKNALPISGQKPWYRVPPGEEVKEETS